MPTDIEYAQLSGRVYSRPQRNRTPLPSGWAQIRELTDGANGFSVGVYGKGDEIVIAYTGTNETVPDYVNGNVPAATQVIGDRPRLFSAILSFLTPLERPRIIMVCPRLVC
ncbi:MAG: hypothetical protein ACK5OQ_11340 [Burkholderiales bacterium]